MEAAQNKNSSASPKQDARWARTRQRLVAGGRQAFAERGVEATSVLDIVRAAGVSQPSFYNHFESKQALAHEIATEFFRKDRLAKQKVFASVDDPAEAIAINISQTLAIATEDPVIAWALVKSEALRELVISSTRDPLAEMIKAGAKAGRFVADNPHSVALAIRGGALAVIQDMLNNETDSASQSFQELALRMLGLSPAEATDVVQRALTKNAR
ncbi:MAG: TetR/AcrR family transcriptional regulator [Gammaproteobacteria bacterium]